MCVCDFCGKNCLEFEYVVRCKKCNVSYAHLTCLDDLNVDNYTCTGCMQSILPFHELDNKNFEELFLHQIPLLNKITDKMTDSIDNFFDKQSLYYSVNKFNKLMKEKNENNLVIIHFNTRSLPKNKYQIENFLAEMIVLPEVIAITETKLNNKNKHLTTLDHYEFIHVDSQSQAGGVGFYMRKDLKLNIEKQLNLDLPDCESLFVKIKESSAITKGEKIL